MIVMIIYRKLKSFFLVILSTIRKCFCCFRRKHEDESLPIHFSSGNPLTNNSSDTIDSWESWEGPTSIVSEGGKRPSQENYMQTQIEKFRQEQQRKMLETPEVEEDPNLLEDLAPKIRKKPQVLIYERSREEAIVQAEEAVVLDPMLQGSSLLDWEEEGDWEDEGDVDVDQVIQMQKENYRKQRKEEQMRKKAEREALKGNKQESKLAMKIS